MGLTAGQRNFSDGTGVTFPAYCTIDGWTVIQSRGQFGNPENYFDRGWNAYENGFGDPGMKKSYSVLNEPNVNVY